MGTTRSAGSIFLPGCHPSTLAIYAGIIESLRDYAYFFNRKDADPEHRHAQARYHHAEGAIFVLETIDEPWAMTAAVIARRILRSTGRGDRWLDYWVIEALSPRDEVYIGPDLSELSADEARDQILSWLAAPPRQP